MAKETYNIAKEPYDRSRNCGYVCKRLLIFVCVKRIYGILVG